MSSFLALFFADNSLQARGQERLRKAPPEGAPHGHPGLPAVAVGVAGQGPLDAVPGVARGVLGVAPGELRLALGLLPAVLEIVLGLVPGAAAIAAGRVVAVVVGRAVLVVVAAARVGTGRVVLAPVAVVLGPAGDAVPGVAGGVLGITPGELGLALGLLPAVLEIVLGAAPVAVRVLGPRLPAVPVRRRQVVVGAVRGVGAVGVGRTPVGVLLARVHRFGHALAGQAAGQAAH